MSVKPEFIEALLTEFAEYHEGLMEVKKLAYARGDPLDNIMEIRELVDDILTSGRTPEECLKTVKRTQNV